MLILSAPVGDGHDTAARGVAEELRSLGLEPVIEDGLRLLGRRVEWLVVDGYHAQLNHAGWSWRLLYGGTRSRILIRWIGSLLAVIGGRRLLRRIDAEQAQLVVSTYPLVSAALAALRRSGRLSVACAAIVTDVDPHPAWTHAHLDANFSVAATSLGVAISPPVPKWREPRRAASVVRGLVGAPPGARIALIVGGAWGVGDLEGAARAATAAGLHAVVVCGRNTALRDRLRARSDLAGVAVLGYTRLMPELMSIADVVIQNAGGLTCLEAFRAGVPVVIYRPLQGHGVANARRMLALGLIRVAPTTTELTRLLADESYWLHEAPEACAHARALYDAPTCGGPLAALASRGVQPIRRRHAGRRMRVVTSMTIVLMAFGLADAHARAVSTAREAPKSARRSSEPPARLHVKRIMQARRPADSIRKMPPVNSDLRKPPALPQRRRQALSDEARLVSRAASGDAAAFTVLVDHYGNAVIGICLASTGRRCDAEELAQDVFLSAWRALPRFRAQSSFATWLFALSRNACIDHARRAASRPRPAHDDALAELASPTSDPHARITALAALAACATLSKPKREALILRDLYGLAYEEIADIQGVPIGTVRSRIADARKKIAAAIS